ncbi:MAG TPA: 2-oxo acid dehydrogenase subunit E2 [Verrucomicrobiae bacterium]|nr:2-oxo acid dehydrogenase subunit E2 [Verrucomicrobiae bacterium]
MATRITLPQLGEGIEAGDIVNVLVSAGDVVRKDQALAEIETDKAVVEFPSPDDGRITKVSVKAGDHVKVGALLFELESGAEKREPTESVREGERAAKNPSASVAADRERAGSVAVGAGRSAQGPPPPVAAGGTSEVVRLPQLGEGIEGGDVLNVLVKAGDAISKDQSIAEVETDKAVVEVPSPVSGRVAELLIKAGDHIKVGADLMCVDIAAASGTAPEAPMAAPPGPIPAAAATEKPAAVPGPPRAPGGPQPPAADGRQVPAGPATRRLARELGVDLTRVRGSATGGRITIDDVKAFVRSGGMAAAAGGGAGHVPAAQPLPDFSQWGPIERKPVSSLRRKIADQMAVAWSAPMVTHFDEADITELEAFRKQFAPRVKEAGGALTMTTIAIKAVVEGLKEFPQLNSSFDAARGEMIVKGYYHISVAVDTPAGLIVPVVRDADKKSLRELAIELNRLAQRARDRKVSVEELQGGTFTISNLGGIGGTGFTPLLNPPQVGILGLARGSLRAVWRDGRFEPRLIMPLSVTYDHRVIDGADGARFTRRVARAFEEFAGALLDV